MDNGLRLFIGSYEAELASNPSILYTYTVDDFTNPTAVKNSFSKTITLQGTPNNNKIFGQYWNVERAVGNGGGNAGVDFNASKKAPFYLYLNGDIVESGYVKLEKVNRINNTITYDISLYGGLGDFFYNLSYNNNTGEKLKLSDLNFMGGGESEFDFTISANTVKNAWFELERNDEGKWEHINFIPSYNGIPEDFDADKVILNLSGTSLPQTDEYGIFKPRSGYTIADLPEEMNEWEIRDIRSYLQRPCVRMKSIIDACCDPAQNGGYEVVLDEDFFASGNPYYQKTWLTRPLIKDLQFDTEEQILTGATLIGLTTTGDMETFMYQDLKFEVGEYSSSVPSSIRVGSYVYCNNLVNEAGIVIPSTGTLFHVDTPSTSFAWFWNSGGDTYHTGWFCLGSLFCQLIALNGEVVVGASEAYNLTTPIRHNGKLYYGHNGRYSTENQFKPYMDKPIYNVLGTFEDDGFHREGEGQPAYLSFNITQLSSPVSQLKMVYWWGATDDKVNRYGRVSLFGEEQESSWIDIGGPDMDRYYNIAPYALTVGIQSTNFNAVLGESLGRTGTKVTKATLLNSESSPCDYLLAYCKMFGLYFRKEPDENIIHIETRNTFYKRNEVVNLNNYIDRGKDIKIDPIFFNTKWYKMAQDADETEYFKQYKDTRGIEYGCKMLNTGYEFSTDKKDLYEGTCIKSGIEGLERSKYYSAYNNDRVNRSWMGMGLHYNLYFGTEEQEINVPINNNSTLWGINEGEGMKYYDVFPKLQFHTDADKATDGSDCLVFLSGFKSVTARRNNPLYYYITDDNMWQVIFNDGTPCWLFTPSETDFAKRVTSFPVFERYYTNNQSGTVNKSLDFGTAQELFIPNYNITEDANIYSNYWKTYLEDLFSPDTKVLTCYVVIKGKVTNEWMRRFYWFDNAIWRVNKITDWNICGNGSTQVEFVKVQDASDYTTVTQSAATVITLSASRQSISYQGGSATLDVTISSGGNWRIMINGSDGAVLSNTSGTGDGSVTLTVPSNNGSTNNNYYITVTSDDNAQASTTIIQSYEGEVDFTPTPNPILLPADSGSVMVDMIWKNQGEDYVASASSLTGAEFVPITADTITMKDENKIVITFPANTGNTVLNNLITLTDETGEIVKTIGVDQTPVLEQFAAEGGEQIIHFQYNTAVTFTTPEWITVTDNGNGNYTITARENVYGSDQNGNIVISNGSGSVTVPVSQGNNGGVTGNTNTTGITPTNLYYSAVDNTTKFVTINLTEPWVGSIESGSFFTVSQDNGDAGMTVVGVNVDENTGNTRTGVFRVSYGNSTTDVIITQLGSGATEAINVNPSAITVSSGASDQQIEVTYYGRNGYVITPVISDSAVTVSSLSWTGETARTTVRIPQNETTSAKTITITFNGREATGSTVITQAAANMTARADVSIHSFGYSGGTANNGITANDAWSANTSDGWISVTPTSGSDGYTSISISAAPNTAFSARTGYVYICSQADSSVITTITVNQDAFEEILTVNPSSIVFDSTGGIATFTITSNSNWTIE